MNKLKGTLEFYVATGEQPRPQFICQDSYDNKGFIVNYNGIYDISVGDKVRFLNPILEHEKFSTIDDDLYTFLYWLTLMWNQKIIKLEVEYQPSKTTKSWGYYSSRSIK